MVAGAYAVSVPNDFMEPRYLLGETVYINPSLPPRTGDFVLARKVDGAVMIGQIRHLDSSSITLCVCNGNDVEEVYPRAGLSLHRIVASAIGS